MNRSSLVLACSLTVLAPACVATEDLAVSAQAVEVLASPGPVPATFRGLNRVEIAELRASVASETRSPQILVEVRIEANREVHVPRMVLQEDEEAIAFVGCSEDGAPKSAFEVRVHVSGSEAALTIIEWRAGKVVARGSETIPIEAAPERRAGLR